jgi:hypothetical protein
MIRMKMERLSGGKPGLAWVCVELTGGEERKCQRDS